MHVDDFLDQLSDSLPALRRYARALTRDRDSADDLVQDCVERAISRRGLYRPTGAMRAWLFTILLNIWRNAGRHRRRRGDNVPLDMLTIEPATPAPQPGRVALAEMARALDTLPDDQREVILLVALEGFSYAEAASILKIPTGTLMSRLFRARAALRALTEAADEPRLRTIK